VLDRPVQAEQHPGHARVVAVLLFPGVRLLDVTGPAEVLATAAALGADYEVLLCSTRAGPIVPRQALC
jgi:putative intracellular protease/amidase